MSSSGKGTMIDSLSSGDSASGEEESASRDSASGEEESASGEEKVISGEEGREKVISGKEGREKPIVASFFIHLSDSIPKKVFIVKINVSL